MNPKSTIAAIFLLATTFFAAADAATVPIAPLPSDKTKQAPAVAGTETSSYLAVESSGVGTNREEALLDARRNAVQQAVGVVSKGLTQTIDGRAAENISQLSRAFIEKYEILKEQKDSGRYRVEIKAYIRRDNLMEGLVNYRPDKSSVDGISLFTKSATKEQQIREASDILIEFLTSIPVSNYIRVSAESDSFSGKDGKLNLGVRLTFDKELYYSLLAPQLVTVLNYISSAGNHDVPMAFDMGDGKKIPPSSPDSFSKCLKLMEASDGNRYIEIPDVGGFANIYLATKSYYFNCYRVAPEVFTALMERMLIPDKQGRLGGEILSSAELVISFRSKNGQQIKEHRQPINLTNSIVFANSKGLKKAVYSEKKGGPLSEQHHSFFIMPYMGFYSASDSDYTLVEDDSAQIDVPMKDSEIKLIDSVECRIETNISTGS